MVDFSTSRNLELVANITDPKGATLYSGLFQITAVLNKTSTVMGSRLLRVNILQPLNDLCTILARNDAIDEILSEESTFFTLQRLLKPFRDIDQLVY